MLEGLKGISSSGILLVILPFSFFVLICIALVFFYIFGQFRKRSLILSSNAYIWWHSDDPDPYRTFDIQAKRPSIKCKCKRWSRAFRTAWMPAAGENKNLRQYQCSKCGQVFYSDIGENGPEIAYPERKNDLELVNLDMDKVKDSGGNWWYRELWFMDYHIVKWLYEDKDESGNFVLKPYIPAIQGDAITSSELAENIDWRRAKGPLGVKLPLLQKIAYAAPLLLGLASVVGIVFLGFFLLASRGG